MAEAIRFGASISTSGRYALQGRQALAGLQAWAKATNVEGGVRISQLGGMLPVTLIHYDDAGSPERAVANVERLISVDRVRVLIGPYASDLTRAVVHVARQYGKLLWNHGGASDYPAAQAYAACLIAQHCLEEAGSADDEALWRAACALDCTTFFGRFRINPRTGIQDRHEMVWVQWQGGRRVVVWPPSLAQAGPVYPRR